MSAFAACVLRRLLNILFPLPDTRRNHKNRSTR